MATIKDGEAVGDPVDFTSIIEKVSGKSKSQLPALCYGQAIENEADEKGPDCQIRFQFQKINLRTD